MKIKRIRRYYQKQKGKECLQLLKNENILQIILVRHGKPILERFGWGKSHRARQFFQDYDAALVKELGGHTVCKDVLVSKIFASTLPRAKTSAKLLFPNKDVVTSHQFRELEREVPKTNMILPLKIWTVLARINWFIGRHTNRIENKREGIDRVSKNAIFLEEKAYEFETIVLVAHGFHNRLLKIYLKKTGWKLILKGNGSFWSTDVLIKDNEHNQFSSKFQ